MTDFLKVNYRFENKLDKGFLVSQKEVIHNGKEEEKSSEEEEKGNEKEKGQKEKEKVA